MFRSSLSVAVVVASMLAMVLAAVGEEKAFVFSGEMQYFIIPVVGVKRFGVEFFKQRLSVV